MQRELSIILITGFLGSGKTTLINRLIKAKGDAKIALILNEFGEVSLESQFIQKSDEEIIEFSNGCMCCVVRSDLISAVAALLNRQPDLDCILIEASGLSDPEPILQTFNSPAKDHRINIESVVCMIDAENFSESISNYPTVQKQIQCSDFIVISKIQNIPDSRVSKIRDEIKNISPKIKFLDYETIFLPDLLMSPKLNLKKTLKPSTLEEHEHNERIDSFIYRSNTPMDFARLDSFFENLPDGIIRGKGVVDFGDSAYYQEMKFLLQYVGSRVNATPTPWLDGEKHETAILFLGTDIDPVWMQKQLDACRLQ